MMKRTACHALLFVFAIVFIPATWAGMYWESQVISTGVPGAGEGVKVTKNYQTDFALRTDNDDGITIFNFETGIFYSIDPEKKTYSETKLDEMFKPDDESAQFAQSFMKQMAENMSIKKTDETKEINGYNCTKYIVTIMGMDTIQWVTKDIEGYKELREAASKYAEKLKNNPQLSSMLGMGEAYKEIDGFPIKTTSEMGPVKSETTVIKVEMKDLDKSLFSIPEGYAKVKSTF
ncbi:DUF4412 domain-containing protein [bacterium]|nr:DUF4412 domain-containing protein [candidate division CSSED10-310 bacterium]